MPHRPMSREQMWRCRRVLRSCCQETIQLDLLGEFVDALEEENWAELGVEIEGGRLGAPAYHPRGLERVVVWVHDGSEV